MQSRIRNVGAIGFEIALSCFAVFCTEGHRRGCQICKGGLMTGRILSTSAAGFRIQSQYRRYKSQLRRFTWLHQRLQCTRMHEWIRNVEHQNSVGKPQVQSPIEMHSSPLNFTQRTFRPLNRCRNVLIVCDECADRDTKRTGFLITKHGLVPI